MVKKKNINLDNKEIRSQLSESRKLLLNLRFQKVNGQLGNTSQLKKTKRKIAKLLTQERKFVGLKNA